MEKRQQRGLFTVPGLLLAFCSHVAELGLLLIDPVMTSELHLDLFRTLGCRRAFFIGENPS